MADDWRQDLVALFSSPVPEDWQKALTLKHGDIPARLFRYRPASEHALANLANQSIWLAPAARQNDPYDSSVTFNFIEAAESLLRTHINGNAQLPPEALEQFRRAPNVTDAMDAFFVTEVEKKSGTGAAAKAIGFFRKFIGGQSAELTTQFNALFQRTMIACFSEVRPEEGHLLWAHYGNNKGFCLEYSLTGLPMTDLRARWLVPVVYSTERCRINLLEKKPRPFLTFVAAMHKSEVWAYEREWRLVVPPQGDAVPGLEWKTPTPSRLFLGSQIEPSYRKKVLDVARGQRMEVFEMKLSSRGYELGADRVT